MKKVITTLFLFAAVTTFVACSDDDNDSPTVCPVESQAIYSGALTVTGGDYPSNYVQDSVSVSVEYNDTTKTATINFYDVRFSSRMPVTLPNMKIAGVAYVNSEGTISLSGDSIVPTSSDRPFANYTITGLTGTVENSVFNLSMMCGTYPTSYQGSLVE